MVGIDSFTSVVGLLEIPDLPIELNAVTEQTHSVVTNYSTATL